MPVKLKDIAPINPEGSFPGEPIFPSFHLTEGDLPQVKDWDVGEEYTLTVKVKMEGKNDTPRGIEGRFEIHKVGSED